MQLLWKCPIEYSMLFFFVAFKVCVTFSKTKIQCGVRFHYRGLLSMGGEMKIEIMKTIHHTSSLQILLHAVLSYYKLSHHRSHCHHPAFLNSLSVCEDLHICGQSKIWRARVTLPHKLWYILIIYCDEYCLLHYTALLHVLHEAGVQGRRLGSTLQQPHFQSQNKRLSIPT